VLDRAAKTIIGYRSIARTASSRIGATKLRRLSADDLDGYYAWLRSTRGVSATTVAHHHMLIAQTFNMAIERRWAVPPNPARAARAPTVERPTPTAPTVAEAQLFIRALAAKPETNDKAALLLLAGITSCRRGEVCAWRWSDFDRDAGQLTVQRAISMGQHGPEERRTKTKQERRLAVDAKTIAVLATQWDRYASTCREAEFVPDWDSYVFSGQVDHSTPLNPNSVTQAFRRLRGRLVADMRRRAEETADVALARQANRLEQVKLGHFRHFGATQMSGAGIDVKTASARLGHDGAVFLRHYAGVIDAHDQAAGELLSSLLMPALEL
jgi:integrase